ncbi:hypothetical protein KFK09_015685 [Dendrobium nobile]|uniref:Uncharacterized protein n=1 Tax=Dendrobium nobile TaxID=94219 RepID=A0A8T3B6S8_DENNO|nr:hypothetical protein KFK09_015685 [Dendrobium nobile]
MMKRKIRVSVDPGPSSSFLVGEEDRARFKHQCLLQDYQELLKETEGKKERLNKALQRKLKLLAEVKFLSKKYQSFSNIPGVSAKPGRVKRQSCKEVNQPYHPVIGTKPPLKERNLKSKEVSVQSFPKLTDLNRFKVPLKERNRKTNEASVQTAPKLLDLNQVSLPNGEEMELDVKWEPLKIDKLKRTFIEGGDAMVDDIKFSVCREIGSSQSGWGTGKFHGKISSL